MNNLSKALGLCFIFLLNLNSNAQSTADYFSTEGLTFGAVTYDDTWQIISGGYSFVTRSDVGDTSKILYAGNTTLFPFLIQVVGDRVYRGTTLYYDFGAELGDTITEGYYNGAVVTNKYFETLLNGEERRAIDIELEVDVFGYIQNRNFTWVEGIGDIGIGMFPWSILSFPNYTDIFGCAKIYNEPILVITDGVCGGFSCPLPYSSFEYESEDLTVTLTNTSFRGEEFLWDFGDGNTTSEENPIHEYDAPGCYEVTLTTKSYCSEWENPRTQRVSVCQVGPWFAKEVPIENRNKRVKHLAKDLIFVWAPDSLIRSTTQGDDWEFVSLPQMNDSFTLNIYDIHMFDDDAGFLTAKLESISSAIDKIYLTKNSGLTWEESNFSGHHSFGTVIWENGKALLDGDNDQFYTTSDFGLNWETITLPDNYNFLELQSTSDSMILAQMNTLEGSTQKRWLAFSNDFGETWLVNAMPDNITQITMTSDSVWYGAEIIWGEGLYRSEDRGNTWTEILPDRIMQLVMINDLEGWCVVNPYEIYYTTDGFQTFTRDKCNSASRWITSSEAGSGATVDASNFYYFDPEKAHTCLDVDADGDGYFDNVDCDDTNPLIYPGATEIANNGIDEDCDDLDLISNTFEELTLQMNIYPNPVQNILNIEISREGAFKAKIISNIGAVVIEQDFSKYLSLDVVALPAGTYFIEIVDTKTATSAFEQLVRL